MKESLSWWSIGCSVIAFLAALVAVARTGHWDVQWGPVAEWIGGIGSILAALAAVGIALYGNSRQQKETRDRALRRVKRIKLEDHVRRPKVSEMRPSYTADVENKGSAPIYELKWYPPIVISQLSPDRVGVWCATAAHTGYGNSAMNVLSAKPRNLDVREKDRIELEPLNHQVLRIYPLVTFVDEDGYRFGWTLRPGTTTGSSAPHPAQFDGEWSIVGNDYPSKVPGPLGELLEQAEGWAPSGVLPTPAEFRIDVIVTQKTHYFTGWHLLYQLRAEYIGAGTLTSSPFTVIYQLSGGKDPQVGDFTVTNGKPNVDTPGAIDAESEESVLTATAFQIVPD